jgi:hypothetical protein
MVKWLNRPEWLKPVAVCPYSHYYWCEIVEMIIDCHCKLYGMSFLSRHWEVTHIDAKLQKPPRARVVSTVLFGFVPVLLSMRKVLGRFSIQEEPICFEGACSSFWD